MTRGRPHGMRPALRSGALPPRPGLDTTSPRIGTVRARSLPFADAAMVPDPKPWVIGEVRLRASTGPPGCAGIATVGHNFDRIGSLMGEVVLFGEVPLLGREDCWEGWPRRSDRRGARAAAPPTRPGTADSQGQHDDTVAQNSFDEPLRQDPRLARIRAPETLPDNGQAQGVHAIAE